MTIQRFTPARYRHGGADFDRTLREQLKDVMKAQEQKDGAYNRWWRATRRLANLHNMIKTAEEEFENLMAVEQMCREVCHAPMVELARVWTTSKLQFRKRC
ncbi:hypothetical protein M758_UG227100 [Ceratodon purpureus]|nr:hypothetical protein M758_UG227100 [Ceratodon purpureus]